MLDDFWGGELGSFGYTDEQDEQPARHELCFFASWYGVEALPADAPIIPDGRRRFDSASTPIYVSTLFMSRHRRVFIVAAAMVGLLLLYALAAGPLVYLRRVGRPLLSDRAFAVIYHPLIRAEARIPPVGMAMHCYVGLWERAADRQRDQPNTH